MSEKKCPLVLASGSAIRAEILRDAGVCFETAPVDIDEAAIRDILWDKKATAAQTAQELAKNKAIEAARRYPHTFVLGCDQILECEGRWYEKQPTIRAAKTQLVSLRGKTHRLVNGLSVIKNGQEIWAFDNAVELTMRDFSDDFVESYLEKCGPAVLSSVGCYQLENMGAQLFSSITGDYFSVLGLPLLPLLGFLRKEGVLDI